MQQNRGSWNMTRRQGAAFRQIAALSAFLSLGSCAPQPVPASSAALAPGGGDDGTTGAALYLDPSQPFEARARDLVARMTREEKISQMVDRAPAIERLGVPAYQWWNEALHGVARAGLATVFPQAIALAATFDEPLVQQIAGVIADEARAKHHEFLRQGQRERYQGLTFFSPNINIFRDPRWGRGHETYGEDPYLTGRLGVAFIRGLQGDHPKYYKTLATAKHFAVHSGPESERHRFDARVSPHDLYDTYLPQFEMAVKEAKVGSVMAAYNALDGKAAAANDVLLGQILRNQWGFNGYVVTDCYAIKDIYKDHGQAKDAAEASALAVKAGTDLECGQEFRSLGAALERNLVSEAALDQALLRLFFARFALGMFDPAEQVPFAQIPYSKNDAPEHRALARRAALESLVLLENRGVLPIAPHVKKLALIGPTGNDVEVLLGNYHGTPSAQVTIQSGLE
ncbi:MAG TPA: glycoside hydrolase family 3 N-terminal domain-containing protein, partial [Polyangiaceae bacterium]|nr:glycoside hydrolase family 3 N-terminal domain-containing protein [Polyangiaceae bacterium]